MVRASPFVALLLAVVLLGVVAPAAAFAPEPAAGPSAPPAAGAAPGVARPTPFLLNRLQLAGREMPRVDYLRVTADGARVSCLAGELSRPEAGGGEVVARAFVIRHAGLLVPQLMRGEAALAVQRDDDRGAARHVVFAVRVGDVPVLGAQVGVHLGRDGVVRLVHSQVPALGPVANRADLPVFEGIRAARKHLHVDNMRVAPRADLVLVPQRGRLRLAWAVQLACHRPFGDWLVLVDAQSGRVLSTENRMLAAAPAAGGTAPFAGRGKVFVHHPLAGPAEMQPLPDLTTDTLRGLYADVQNDDSMSAHASNGEHLYDPSNKHFDEVNVYYHLNRAHAYFKRFGFDKLDRPLLAAVHYGDGLDNAYWAPWAEAILIGDGERYNDLAQEEAVIYHEYAHAVVYQIVRLGGAEGPALNEGQADYFAAALSSDPVIGEYVVKKANRPYLRTLANRKQYPQDLAHEPHDDGEIWGGALCDLRRKLGGEVADALVHESLYYLPEACRFVDGLLGLLAADRDHHGGANRGALLEVMAARGFVLPSPDALTGRDLARRSLFDSVYGEVR